MTGLDVEIVIESDRGVTIVPSTGATEPWQGMRVRYRFAGERRWRKFLLSAEPGHSLRDLLEAAVHVVSLQERNRAGGERQLRIEGALA